MNELAKLTVEEFSELLGSDAPAPGGGSAAALLGSVGAALVRMVAALTLGREKYREHAGLMQELVSNAEKLRKDLLVVMDNDTKAYNGVSAVFSMPNSTDEQKAARKTAMQSALKACTRTPYEIMELALNALELMDMGMDKINSNAVSDFGVAALSLKAAVQGAWLNVLVNTGSINDEQFIGKYLAGGEDIVKESVKLADSIYARVLDALI